jgi:hypothetical protein
LFNVQKPYMITVKGMGTADRRPYAMKSLSPYVALIVLGLSVCWFHLAVYEHADTQGLLYFALSGSLVFLVVTYVVIYQDFMVRRMAMGNRRQVAPLFRTAFATLTALSVAWAATAAAATTPIIDALRYLS